MNKQLTRLQHLGIASIVLGGMYIEGDDGVLYKILFEDISKHKDGSRVVASVIVPKGITIYEMLVTNVTHSSAVLANLVGYNEKVNVKWFKDWGWASPKADLNYYDHYRGFGDIFTLEGSDE